MYSNHQVFSRETIQETTSVCGCGLGYKLTKASQSQTKPNFTNKNQTIQNPIYQKQANNNRTNNNRTNLNISKSFITF